MNKLLYSLGFAKTTQMKKVIVARKFRAVITVQSFLTCLYIYIFNTKTRSTPSQTPKLTKTKSGPCTLCIT